MKSTQPALFHLARTETPFQRESRRRGAPAEVRLVRLRNNARALRKHEQTKNEPTRSDLALPSKGFPK